MNCFRVSIARQDVQAGGIFCHQLGGPRGRISLLAKIRRDYDSDADNPQYTLGLVFPCLHDKRNPGFLATRRTTMEEKWIFLAGLVLLSALANQGMMMTMMLTGKHCLQRL